jgi:FkbM family methyltransferase
MASDHQIAPFSLRPQPAQAGSCPRGHGALRVGRVRIAGWRSLLEGDCPACGHSYLQDLPAGHGLVYPATLDRDTGEVFDPEAAAWFSAALRRYWEEPDVAPVRLRVDRRTATDDAVLLNCLDVVYGHALLKLLNATRHRDEGCIVLVPAALEPLMPDWVSEAWVAEVGFGRLRRSLPDLERAVEGELARLPRCRLSPAFPHPHPSTYDLDDYVGAVRARAARAAPNVVLVLRDDRTWGRSKRLQASNVDHFARRLLKSHPDAAITAIGVAAGGGLPARVEDLRTPRPSADDERRWLEVLAGADLAVGVHGSNLLVPSAMARATIELLPRERYGNLLQATLVREHDPLEALANHRILYGDKSLSDVSGRRVAEVAATLLSERDRFDALMLGPLSGRDGGGAQRLPGVPDDPDLRPPPLIRHAPAARALAARAQDAPLVIRTVAERFRAQLRARTIDVPVVLDDWRGLRFELVDRGEVVAFLQHGGHFERAEMELLTAALRRGDVALDVGANIGHFAAGFARAVGPDGEVHAFEPFTSNFVRLERTAQLNDLRTLRGHRLIVADQPGTAELIDYGAGYGSWASTVPRTIELASGVVAPVARHTVASTTLDAFCAEHRLDRIAALKIDVEGGEMAVLDGARGLLDAGAVEVVLVEVSDNTLPDGVTSAQLVDRLEQAGLQPCVLRRGRLVPFRPAGPVAFTNVVAATPAAMTRLSR